MKKLIISSALLISGLIATSAKAQIGIHVGFGIGAPVYRTPVVVHDEPVYQDQAQVGYDDDDYYYLPDVDAYYDINAQCYYYNNGSNWVSAAYLPGEYRDYDWRNARHYEVRARRPFMNNAYYRSRYNGFEGRRDWNHFDRRFDNGQRYSRENYHAEQHFDNHGWNGERGYDNQRGYGQVYRQQDQHQQGNWSGQQFNQNRGGDRGQQFDQNRGGDRGQQFNQNRGGDRGQQPNQNQARGQNGGQNSNQNNDRGHGDRGTERH
jgi:hypothetical protein